MSKRRSKIPIRLKNYKFPDKYQSIAIQTSFNLNSKQLNTTFVIDKKNEINNSTTEIESSPIYSSTPFRKRVSGARQPKDLDSLASTTKSRSSDDQQHHDDDRSHEKEEEHQHDMVYHDTSIEKPKRNVVEGVHKKTHGNQYSTGIFKQKSNDDDLISPSRSMIHFYLSDEDDTSRSKLQSRVESHGTSREKSKESERKRKSKRDSSSEFEDTPKKPRRNIIISSDSNSSQSEQESLERTNYKTPKAIRTVYRRTDLTDKISKLSLNKSDMNKTRNQTDAQMDYMDNYETSTVEHRSVDDYGLPMESFDLHSDLENMFTDQNVSSVLRNSDHQQPHTSHESNQRTSQSQRGASKKAKKSKSRRKKKRYTSSMRTERFQSKNPSVRLRICIEEIEKLLNPDPRLRRSERLRLKQLKKLRLEKQMLQSILDDRNAHQIDENEVFIDDHNYIIESIREPNHDQESSHNQQDHQQRSSSPEIIVVDSSNVTRRKTNPEYKEQQREVRTSRRLFAPYVSLVRVDEE